MNFEIRDQFQMTIRAPSGLPFATPSRMGNVHWQIGYLGQRLRPESHQVCRPCHVHPAFGGNDFKPSLPTRMSRVKRNRTH
jgi:hypothetical protein